ncbi:MAG: RNA polymerase sigma-70 factor [Bacteroidota bacterium]|nr:RNA polymerase sigma-70 factor [Bacteroidota bacterium]
MNQFENRLLDDVLDRGRLFEELFRNYYGSLCNFANKFVHDWDESEEVVQEVFYRLWKNRQILHESQSLKPLLFKAVQNRCINYLEHKKIVQKHASEIQTAAQQEWFSANDTSSPLTQDELNQAIQRGIDTLPVHCKRIFEMSRIEGLSYKEIASQLGVSVKTVETQISRALKKLRADIADFLPFLLIVLSSFLIKK